MNSNDREVLNHSGKITKNKADEKASKEYDEYSKKRREKKELEAEKNYIDELEKCAKLIKD